MEPGRGHPFGHFRVHVFDQMVVEGGPRVRAFGPLGQAFAFGPVVVQLVMPGCDVVSGQAFQFGGDDTPHGLGTRGRAHPEYPWLS
jgi:hypothetical protein